MPHCARVASTMTQAPGLSRPAGRPDRGVDVPRPRTGDPARTSSVAGLDDHVSARAKGSRNACHEDADGGSGVVLIGTRALLGFGHARRKAVIGAAVGNSGSPPVREGAAPHGRPSAVRSSKLICGTRDRIRPRLVAAVVDEATFPRSW